MNCLDVMKRKPGKTPFLMSFGGNSLTESMSLQSKLLHGQLLLLLLPQAWPLEQMEMWASLLKGSIQHVFS